jgi:hypothetical protein
VPAVAIPSGGLGSPVFVIDKVVGNETVLVPEFDVLHRRSCDHVPRSSIQFCERKVPTIVDYSPQCVVKIDMNFLRAACIDNRNNLPLQKAGLGNLTACIVHHVIMSVDPALNSLKEK